MEILLVVGARPNLMKVAPIMRAIDTHNWIHSLLSIDYTLLHTGQHYDDNMSGNFFSVLGMREPDINLGIGSGTHAEQTAKVLIGIEKVLLDKKYDLVMVFGDINSTVAAALTATKLHVPVAHVESGLRSCDRTMPEEVNRITTDHISDYLFCTTSEAANNLVHEGINIQKVFVTGDTMLDSIRYMWEEIEANDVVERYGLAKNGYAVLTLHRPSNVDDPVVLKEIMDAIGSLATLTKVVFPCHPRTRIKIKDNDVNIQERILLIDPLCYVDFLALVKDAQIVITDSGSLQVETSAIGVSCITLRNNTERPETITNGTNVLANSKTLLEAIEIQLKKSSEKNAFITDGCAAKRIIEVLAGKKGVM